MKRSACSPTKGRTLGVGAQQQARQTAGQQGSPGGCAHEVWLKEEMRAKLPAGWWIA